MEKKELLSDLVDFIKNNGDIDDLILQANKIIEDKKNIITIVFDNKDFKPPYDGWVLESDNGNMPVGKVTFKLVSFLKDGETIISGVEMINRAKEMGADYSQKTAEVFFSELG